MQVKDLIDVTPMTVATEASVLVAARIMRQTQASLLPVCDGRGKLVGVVAAGDLVHRGMVLGPYVFELKVEDLMTRHAVWCSANEDVADVARLMHINKICNLPVMDADNQVIGVVTVQDIAASMLSQPRSSLMDADTRSGPALKRPN